MLLLLVLRLVSVLVELSVDVLRLLCVLLLCVLVELDELVSSTLAIANSPVSGLVNPLLAFQRSSNPAFVLNLILLDLDSTALRISTSCASSIKSRGSSIENSSVEPDSVCSVNVSRGETPISQIVIRRLSSPIAFPRLKLTLSPTDQFP